MTPIDDSELHQIVQRVVERVLTPSAPAAVPAPVPAPVSTAAKAPEPPMGKVVAIGADHGGFEMKEMLKVELRIWGYEFIDAGTNSRDAVDYPDFAHAVAQLVATGKAWRGIMIDGAGIGSCIVANKVPGVRAGMAYDFTTAVNSREHNDTNVLTLGAGLIGLNLARQIVKTWLTTDFGGDRHQKRINKITSVEKQYLK